MADPRDFPSEPLACFTVFGTPEPQGSMKLYRNRRTGRARLTSDNPDLKPWRYIVGMEARAARGGRELSKAAIHVQVDFIFLRPKSVTKARIHPTVKPDTDKLLRALFDSMTGVIYQDDAQIVRVEMTKQYGPEAKAVVSVRELTELVAPYSGTSLREEVSGEPCRDISSNGRSPE